VGKISAVQSEASAELSLFGLPLLSHRAQKLYSVLYSDIFDILLVVGLREGFNHSASRNAYCQDGLLVVVAGSARSCLAVPDSYVCESPRKQVMRSLAAHADVVAAAASAVVKAAAALACSLPNYAFLLRCTRGTRKKSSDWQFPANDLAATFLLPFLIQPTHLRRTTSRALFPLSPVHILRSYVRYKKGQSPFFARNNSTKGEWI
jgi:hypothetical protein